MNTADLYQCLDIANKEFEKHQADTFRHWSFIFQNGKVLEWAQNRLGNPVGLHKLGYLDKRHSIHAEPRAFMKARGILNRRKAWECVNVRLGANREPRMSLPCWRCLNFLKALDCSMIHFTTKEGIFAHFNPQKIPWELYSPHNPDTCTNVRNAKRR